MEYLNNRITRTEFVKTRGSLRTQQNANTCLNLFDFFCTGMYQKNGDNVILDMENVIKQDANYDDYFDYATLLSCGFKRISLTA